MNEMNERDHLDNLSERDQGQDWMARFRAGLRAIATHMRDDGLLDERSHAYLLFLIATGQGECRYDDRPGVNPHGVVHYRGAWHDARVFCHMAGELRGCDSDPHPFGGRRW